jgi:hypothetical protein
MSMCRSHCDGDRIHPVWERTFAASLAAFFAAFSACQTETNGKTAESGEGQPHPDFLVRKGRRNPLATMGSLNAHHKLSRAMG